MLGDRNVIKKEDEKFIKYKEFTREIIIKRNVKTQVRSAAPGAISKSLRHYLSKISGKHEIKALQKKSHTGHCTHTEKVQSTKISTS